MQKFKFFILLLFAMAFEVTWADPAWPDSVLVHQPDGTDLWVYDRGDEFLNWVESADGFVIVKNSQEVFEYATIEGERLSPSGLKVHNLREKELFEINYAEAQVNQVQNALISLNNSLRKKNTPHRTPNIPTSPVIGTRKVLTILAQFTDKPFTYASTNFDSIMNTVGYSGHGNAGSVRDYYNENSYGQLIIQSTVIGPFTASHNSSYYSRPQGSTAGHADDLVVEAINWADVQGIDFSTLDGNNDGYVDCVHVVFAGNRYSSGGTGIIWPFNSAFTTPIVKDGKNISEFIMTPEKLGNSDNDLNSIGTICHELGHVLGAPDFYPIGTGALGNYSLGTSIWDIMGKGSNYNGGYAPSSHNPYTKTSIFKWTTPRNISSTLNNAVYNIPSSSVDSTAIYKISTSTMGEFYLIENRQNYSFDSCKLDSGLLIYHIHKDIEAAIATNTINTNLPQKCYLVDPRASQAVPSTDTTSYGESETNIFPANHLDGITNIFFSCQTTPRSQSWAGDTTGVNICFIQHNGNNMKFVVNPKIEGLEVLPDSGWYHIHNVPAGATITWSLTNRLSLTREYVLASTQGLDSMYVALRTASNIIPPFPFSTTGDADPQAFLPQRALLSVTISVDGNSYTISKNIRQGNPSINTFNTSTLEEIVGHDHNYTLELWHSIYGLMQTQTIENIDAPIDMTRLSQGAYIVILKKNGTPIKRSKIMIP